MVGTKPVSHGTTCAPPPIAIVKIRVSLRLSKTVFTKAIKKNSVAMGRNFCHKPSRDWAVS